MKENVCKQCRREGTKLFLKGEKCLIAKCPLVRRKYAPGQHGAKPRKLTDYGVQLREKQKAKRIYGLREQQFKNYYKKAAKHSGDTAEMLFCLLERRLDNVIYRAGIVPSRNLAKQLISHKHILVNQKPVNIPSYLVKEKDTIEINPRSSFPLLSQEDKGTKEKDSLPSWLRWEKNKKKLIVEHLPKKEEMESEIDWAQIIEFYSK